MNQDMERMVKFAETVMLMQGHMAPLVEVHAANNKVMGLLMPELGSKNDTEKEVALQVLKAILTLTNARSCIIVSEAWMREAPIEMSIPEARKLPAIEIVQVQQLNRDGTAASWLGRVRRMEGSGAVEKVEDLNKYSEEPPYGGEYSRLYDGNVPEHVLEKVRKEFADAIRESN